MMQVLLSKRECLQVVAHGRNFLAGVQKQRPENNNKEDFHWLKTDEGIHFNGGIATSGMKKGQIILPASVVSIDVNESGFFL